MIQYFRFILYVITGFFLFIFVYVTFFSDQYRGHKNVVAYSDLGLYGIESESGTGGLKVEKISSKEDLLTEENKSIFLDNSSLLNSYYVSSDGIGSYSKEESGTGEVLNIGEGEYYFNLENPSKKYMINSDEFTIEVISEGSIYVKNYEKTLNIYSFDGIFKVDFKDVYTDEFVSSFYIYPGMHAKGSKYGEQEGTLGTSDMLNELFYISNLKLSGKKQKDTSDSHVVMYSFNFIYSSNEAYGSEGLNTTLKRILGVRTSFLDTVVIHRQKKLNDFRKVYKHLESLKNYETRLFADLENYFYAFFNDSKKVVYYKNVILSDLYNIVKNVDSSTKLGKVLGTEQLEHVKSVQDNLEIIKEISEVEYKLTLKFLEDFYYFFSYVYPSDFSTKHHAKGIFLGINNLESYSSENDRYLAHLFTMYNRGNISLKDLNEGVIKYVVSSSRILDSEDPKSFYYYYYGYNKIIKSYIESTGTEKEGLNGILKVLENISFINDGYFVSKDVEKGMLYINAEIIENILDYFSTLYFEESRNANNLLILNTGNASINDSSILNLKGSIKKMFEYQENSKTLDKSEESDAALLQKYVRFKTESEEYFEAIINNDDYMNAKALGALEKYASHTKQEEEKPSIEELKRYLSEFTQVDTSKANISIIDENYYEIESIKISSEIMSFDLYPLEFNKMTNIKKAAKGMDSLSDILQTEPEDDFKLKSSGEMRIDDLYNYLIALGNIEVYKEDISVEKGTYYKLKNINVGGVKYTFSLFPRTSNAVGDVMEGLGSTYILDNLKPDNDSRSLKKATEDYNNFFVDLVTKTKQAEKELVNTGDEIEKDSVEENIFKNDLLFGDNGDFTKISNKINLQYENVDVDFQDGGYKTFVNDVEMLPKEGFGRTSRGEVPRAKVSSEYVITEEKSYFKEMEILFYFITDSEESIRYNFEKEKLQILGSVDIENFNDFYDTLWDNYKKIGDIHIMKEKIIGETDITNFRYSPSSQEAIISYGFKDDTISITFEKGDPLKIKFGNQVFQGEDLENLEKIFKSFL